MATTVEIENFMLDNFKIMPSNTTDKYLVQYVFEQQADGKVFLMHDTEYANHATIAPSRSNFGLLDYSNSWLDNGSVDRVFLYDVTYLFNDGYVNSNGCSLSQSSDDTHSLSFVQSVNTSDEQQWTIADNGKMNSDYTVYRSTIDYNGYYADIPGSNLRYTSLGSAQSAVMNAFINDGYPTSQSDDFSAQYYDAVVSFVECLLSDTCCLKSCW